MIKFLGARGGRPMIGFGLSRANCEKLVSGKPIFIDLKVMMMRVHEVPDLNEATVLIFGAETDQSMESEITKLLGKPNRIREHNEDN